MSMDLRAHRVLPFAVQLYTVRDYMDKDPEHALKRVRTAGYQYVETAGMYGMNASAFETLLRRMRLMPISMHTGYPEVINTPERVISDAKALNVKFAVVGGIDRALTPDKAGWIACGQALNEAGKTLREHGIQLCYHNHSHEFERIGEEYPYDILFNAAAPENLQAEIDVFWVAYAGLDPARFITKYAGRCPLLHMKDMLDKRSKAFAEVGSGILEWRKILDAAAPAGVQWYIVEQDVCAHDSLTSIQTSAEFMARQ